MKSEVREQYLLILEDRDSFSPYFHIRGVVVEPNEQGGYSSPYLPLSSHVDYPQITCQGDRGTDRLYAFSVKFRDVSPNVEDVNAMYKYVNAIVKKLKSYNTQRGYTDSYAEYFLRVAEAMKITQFIRPSRTDNGNYIFMTASDVRYHIDSIESKLAQKEAA